MKTAPDRAFAFIALLLALIGLAPAAWAHGDLRWTTLTPAEIQRLTVSPAAFEYAPFLPERLRAARLVQQADDHLRFDTDGDGICEGQADLVGVGAAAQWHAVVGRRSQEAAGPAGGREQVDTLEMDWTGRGRASLVLTGHTPLDRVKTRLFILLVDVDDNGVPDLRVEMEPPRAFYWVVAYQYGDAALRAGFVEVIDHWRGRLAHQMARTFHEAEYFFHHGPEFAAAFPTSQRCP
ncbi:MAG: hypothetical protein RDU83_13320 [bacterium]|nr:hypothetical protein [bacterium]